MILEELKKSSMEKKANCNYYWMCCSNRGEIILKKDVDAVVGPQSYQSINKIIKNVEQKKKQQEITDFEVIEKFDMLKNIYNNNSKISSFLTIQEGCDKFCKFCVVPYTRGPEHSRDFYDIFTE